VQSNQIPQNETDTVEVEFPEAPGSEIIQDEDPDSKMIKNKPETS